MYELIKMPNYTQFFEEKVGSGFTGFLVTQINRHLADQLKKFSKETFYYHLELGFIRHQIFRHLRCSLVRFHQLFIVGPHNLQRYNFLHTGNSQTIFRRKEITVIRDEIFTTLLNTEGMCLLGSWWFNDTWWILLLLQYFYFLCIARMINGRESTFLMIFLRYWCGVWPR